MPVLPLRGHEHRDEVPAPVEQAARPAAPVGHAALLRDGALDRLGRQCLADFGVAEGAHAVGIGQGHDPVPGRHAAEEALRIGDVLVLRHVEPAFEVEDRAGDGRQARAIAARAALEPVLEPFQVLDPFVRIADRIGHQVVDRRAAGARRQFAGDGAGLLGAPRGAAGDLEDPGAEIAEHAGERPALVVVAMARRVAAVLRRRRKPERAVIHRLANEALHRRQFFVGCLDALARGLAHDIAANTRMADQGSDIDPALFAERVQVVADRLPGHVDAGLQHRQWDLLGIGEEFEVPLAVAGPHRCDDLAALADDDRRVAVVQPRAAIGVPHGLRVEMGVVVDKARRDHPPRRVDGALGRGAVGAADTDDAAVLHRNIGMEGGCARAVHHTTVFDQQIVSHRVSS